MRRMDRAVTDPKEIVDILSRCQVLRIAINREGAPYILPVNFGMEPDGMTFYFHGASQGTKYDLLDRDNRVGFEADCTHGLVLDEAGHSCTMDYESVLGWGIARELTGQAEKRRALARLMEQYHAQEFPYDETPFDRTRIFAIRVQERTAKRRRKVV